MSRPLPPPHPIEPFLADQGLRASSAREYAAVARRIDASGLAPADWLRAEVEARPSMPKRTLACLRSAVAYMLEWQTGTSRAESNATLPKTRAQPDGTLREGLDPEQLAAYLSAVDQQAEPFRTMLKLLPRTGLRIAELCGLTESRAAYEALGDPVGGWYDVAARELEVTGKRGKTRRVPLTGAARNILDRYLAEQRPPAGRLFWMHHPCLSVLPMGPRAMTPRDVQRVTQRVAKEHPDALYRLTPHRLRHTVATGLLDKGVDVKVIQDVLGHASLRSLEPYLHTNTSKRRAALEKLEE